MNKYVCIAIGVSRCGSLPELPGAINGANSFAEWAAVNGYEVHLITDANAQPVRVEPICELVKAAVESRAVERLIVYFAGHGSPGYAGADCWLLPGAEDDSGEAINLNISALNATHSQIRQIGFIGDACRSRINDADGIGGASLFPRRKATGGLLPQWDRFYACRLGSPAQEVLGTGGHPAYGIFSKCLMKALTGQAAEATERIFEPEAAIAITSGKLADYLEEAVAMESSATPGASVQMPEIISGWRRPNDVYRIVAKIA